MISVDLAQQLAAAGLVWSPEPGDRFTISVGDFDNEVFVISQMTIDVETHHGDTVLKFNGTTEWALDSITADKSLWLPREAQLRERLGNAFLRLEHEPMRDDLESFVVVTGEPGAPAHDLPEPRAEERFVDSDAECAYARALLALLTG